MKTEDELRAAFEQRCIDHLVAQRAVGKPLIDDNGAPATHESLFWKRDDGTYGVHAFNSAWQGYRWGVEDGAAELAIASDARIAELERQLADARKDAEQSGTALKAAKRLFDEALPKFNWGASFLDANAIQLLNSVPDQVAKAIKAKEQP